MLYRLYDFSTREIVCEFESDWEPCGLDDLRKVIEVTNAADYDFTHNVVINGKVYDEIHLRWDAEITPERIAQIVRRNETFNRILGSNRPVDIDKFGWRAKK